MRGSWSTLLLERTRALGQALLPVEDVARQAEHRLEVVPLGEHLEQVLDPRERLALVLDRARELDADPRRLGRVLGARERLGRAGRVVLADLERDADDVDQLAREAARAERAGALLAGDVAPGR